MALHRICPIYPVCPVGARCRTGNAVRPDPEALSALNKGRIRGKVVISHG
jgi:hypothetical protein